MAKDFEFRQLLRAYRGGIISEQTFEAEMGELERGSSGQNGGAGEGFTAFGKTYTSERAAIVSYLDKVRAGESNAGEAFGAWARLCKTECLGTSIRMVAERESYHGRVFGQRLAELGGEARAVAGERGAALMAMLSDPALSDADKLLRLTSRIGKPEDAVAPIFELADSIKEDQSTRDALRLFAEDELSTIKWIFAACAALNPTAAARPTA